MIFTILQIQINPKPIIKQYIPDDISANYSFIKAITITVHIDITYTNDPKLINVAANNVN